MKILIMLSIFNFFGTKSGIVEVKDFGPNPGNLTMYQYIPEGLTENAPLVVVLHGCFQNADTIAVQSGWNKLADENKFMIVYPQQKLTNNLKSCFSWYQEGDYERDSGEVASIKQMIDFAIDQNKLDAERVYITGISAGGAMTSVMMGSYPEMFEAGSVMAGIPYGAAVDLASGLTAMKGKTIRTGEEWAEPILKQHPDFKGEYPRMVLFHGTADSLVSIVNAQEMVKQYKALHHIDSAPEIIKNFDGNENVTLERYVDKNGKDVVDLYSINMKHGISVSPGDGKKQGGKKAMFAIDTKFHSTYWVAEFFGIVK